MINTILITMLVCLLAYCLIYYEGQDEDLEHCIEEEY